MRAALALVLVATAVFVVVKYGRGDSPARTSQAPGPAGKGEILAGMPRPPRWHPSEPAAPDMSPDPARQWLDGPRPQPADLPDREPPPGELHPPTLDVTGDAVLMLEQAQRELRAAARPCVAGRGLPADRKIRMRTLIDVAGDRASLREVEMLESELGDAALETCIIEKIGAATWSMKSPQPTIPLIDVISVAEMTAGS